MRNQLAAFLAMVEVQNRGGDMTHLKAGCVSEDQHLDNRRTDQREARARIAQHLDKFLDDQLPDALKTFLHTHKLFLKDRTAIVPTTAVNRPRPMNWVAFAATPEPLRNTAFKMTT